MFQRKSATALIPLLGLIAVPSAFAGSIKVIKLKHSPSTPSAPTTYLVNGNNQPIDELIDLTKNPYQGTANGAWYLRSDLQPVGTGVFDPFVRIDETPGPKDGLESGYNTDSNTPPLDTKDANQWDHSLLGIDLATVNLAGNTTDYVEFVLDVNENGNYNDLIYLDQVRIFLEDRGDIDTDNVDELVSAYGGKEIYNLDSIPSPNRSVLIDSKVNTPTSEPYVKGHGPGSGVADMRLLVPKSLFDDPDRPFVYLYSSFSGADAGFEEWAARTAPPAPAPTPVPLPSAALGGLGLVAALGAGRIARKSRRA